MKRRRKQIDVTRPLRISSILKWADAHHRRTGAWPNCYSGRILEASSETWNAVQQALVKGHRGMPGADSLARFLARHRHARNRASLPRFTREQILAWADSCHRRTGKWPQPDSGSIPEAPGETWNAVQKALVSGGRGLPGDSSLARFLSKHRGVRNRMQLSRFTQQRILAWADGHQRRTGKWPTVWSGSVWEEPSETWRAVHEALYFGCRGLSGGTTLAQILAKHRGKQSHLDPPPLSTAKLLRWARSYHRRYGRWPKRFSGAITEASGETWSRIDDALLAPKKGPA